MARGATKKCRVLRSALKKSLVSGLKSLDDSFSAARESLERGDEANFLKNLSRARLQINELSAHSMTAITEDCARWCEEEDASERIIQGISAAL